MPRARARGDRPSDTPCASGNHRAAAAGRIIEPAVDFGFVDKYRVARLMMQACQASLTDRITFWVSAFTPPVGDGDAAGGQGAGLLALFTAAMQLAAAGAEEYTGEGGGAHRPSCEGAAVSLLRWLRQAGGSAWASPEGVAQFIQRRATR